MISYNGRLRLARARCMGLGHGDRHVHGCGIARGKSMAQQARQGDAGNGSTDLVGESAHPWNSSGKKATTRAWRAQPQALEASWMVSARWCNGIGENGLRENGVPWLRRKTTKEVFTINKALVFGN